MTTRTWRTFALTSSQRHSSVILRQPIFYTSWSPSKLNLFERAYSSEHRKERTNQLPSSGEAEYLQMNAQRRKLLYRSRERGMLETDLLLGTFALKNLLTLSDKQLQTFEELLDAPDPDIYKWITKKEEAPEQYQTDILTMIQEHTQNNPLGYISGQ